jgi:hypothetical protein
MKRWLLKFMTAYLAILAFVAGLVGLATFVVGLVGLANVLVTTRWGLPVFLVAMTAIVIGVFAALIANNTEGEGL